MKLITERDVIRGVAAAWRTQYAQPHWRKDDEMQGIAKKLEAMDAETATRETVRGIIGNDSWVNTCCDECKQQAPALVHLGDEPDYEMRYLRLCAGCLRKALTLLKPARKA